MDPLVPQPDPGFLARLRTAVDSYDSVSALARMIDRSEGVIRKWLRGESEPLVSDLRAIAGATGYSIEWLATGKGQPRSSDRAEDERGGNRGGGGTNLNKELLTAVIAAVEEYLDQAHVDADKKANLILAAYEMSEDDGRIDRQRVLRLVQLVR